MGGGHQSRFTPPFWFLWTHQPKFEYFYIHPQQMDFRSWQTPPQTVRPRRGCKSALVSSALNSGSKRWADLNQKLRSWEGLWRPIIYPTPYTGSTFKVLVYIREGLNAYWAWCRDMSANAFPPPLWKHFFWPHHFYTVNNSIWNTSERMARAWTTSY